MRTNATVVAALKEAYLNIAEAKAKQCPDDEWMLNEVGALIWRLTGDTRRVLPYLLQSMELKEKVGWLKVYRVHLRIYRITDLAD